MPLSGKLADASQLDIDPRYQLDIPRNGDAPRYFVLVFSFNAPLALAWACVSFSTVTSPCHVSFDNVPLPPSWSDGSIFHRRTLLVFILRVATTAPPNTWLVLSVNDARLNSFCEWSSPRAETPVPRCP